MSNQPEQNPQQPGVPEGSTPPGYYVPPGYMPPPAQGQNPYEPGPHEPGPYGQSPQQPYGGQPYQQPQYPQPYGQPYAAPTYYQGGPGYMDATSGPRGLSLASMIIGLSSLFILGWLMVPQIVGVVLGHIGLRKEKPQGASFAITGLITSYLAIVIWGGLYVVGILLFGVMVTENDTTGYSALVTGV